MSAHTVLVIEDDPDGRESVTEALEDGGFDVAAVASGEKAGEAAAKALRRLLDDDTLLLVSTDFTHFGAAYGFVPFTEDIPASLEKLDTQGVLEIGSTDGNIPLAANCPTVTIGVTRGGNAHRLDEFMETAYVPKGLRHLITLVLAASQTAPEHLSGQEMS